MHRNEYLPDFEGIEGKKRCSSSYGRNKTGLLPVGSWVLSTRLGREGGNYPKLQRPRGSRLLLHAMDILAGARTLTYERGPYPRGDRRTNIATPRPGNAAFFLPRRTLL